MRYNTDYGYEAKLDHVGDLVLTRHLSDSSEIVFLSQADLKAIVKMLEERSKEDSENKD